jgi:hypothetical protein
VFSEEPQKRSSVVSIARTILIGHQTHGPSRGRGFFQRRRLVGHREAYAIVNILKNKVENLEHLKWWIEEQIEDLLFQRTLFFDMIERVSIDSLKFYKQKLLKGSMNDYQVQGSEIEIHEVIAAWTLLQSSNVHPMIISMAWSVTEKHLRLSRAHSEILSSASRRQHIYKRCQNWQECAQIHVSETGCWNLHSI